MIAIILCSKMNHSIVSVFFRLNFLDQKYESLFILEFLCIFSLFLVRWQLIDSIITMSREKSFSTPCTASKII